MISFKRIRVLSILWFIYFGFFIQGCQSETQIIPIMSSYSKDIIGDSVIIDGKLSKVVFRKYSIDDVDSIVYIRNDKHSNIIEQNSYFRGRLAFERITYDKVSGKIRRYSFQSPNCDTCIFVRKYDESGNPLIDSGNVFFLTNVDKVNPRNLEVKDDGSRMHLWIYYPNPPYVKSFMY